MKDKPKKEKDKLSKPNAIGFSTDVNFYGNPKTRELRRKLLRLVPRKIDFADLAPMLVQMIFCFAAKHKVDGDLSGWSAEMFQDAYAEHHIYLSVEESQSVVQAAKDVEFLVEGGKIKSWLKFNKHVATHEKVKRQKEQAGKLGAEAKKLKQQQEIAALKKSGKNGAASEYGIEDAPATQSKPKPTEREIEWNGKLWLQTSLQKAIAELEQQVERKVKQVKKASDELDEAQRDPKRYAAAESSHNVGFTELLDLDRQLASAKTALLGVKVDPPVRRKPKAKTPEARAKSDPKAAEAAFAEFRKVKEAIA